MIYFALTFEYQSFTQDIPERKRGFKSLSWTQKKSPTINSLNSFSGERGFLNLLPGWLEYMPYSVWVWVSLSFQRCKMSGSIFWCTFIFQAQNYVFWMKVIRLLYGFNFNLTIWWILYAIMIPPLYNMYIADFILGYWGGLIFRIKFFPEFFEDWTVCYKQGVYLPGERGRSQGGGTPPGYAKVWWIRSSAFVLLPHLPWWALMSLWCYSPYLST